MTVTTIKVDNEGRVSYVFVRIYFHELIPKTQNEEKIAT